VKILSVPEWSTPKARLYASEPDQTLRAAVWEYISTGMMCPKAMLLYASVLNRRSQTLRAAVWEYAVELNGVSC
jgi:hypothetical protein